MRGYIDALKKAGAVVHDSIFSGDHQGMWIAHLTYRGRTGFISAAFGSCEVCDEWEAYREAVEVEMGLELTDEKKAEFGQKYLDHYEFYTKEELTTRYEKTSEWDLEAGEVLVWLGKLNQ